MWRDKLLRRVAEDDNWLDGARHGKELLCGSGAISPCTPNHSVRVLDVQSSVGRLRRQDAA